MNAEWVTFLEALKMMQAHLSPMMERDRKALLRSVVSVGRVSARGEIREKGSFIGIIGLGPEPEGTNKGFVREGTAYYREEVYPAEVKLVELRQWIESLAQEEELAFRRRFPSLAPLETAGSIAPLNEPACGLGDLEDEPRAFEEQPKVARKRNFHQERVRPVLQTLYPEGIPDPSVVSDAQLCNIVAKQMDEAAKADPRLERAPSRETILRAAGRM